MVNQADHHDHIIISIINFNTRAKMAMKLFSNILNIDVNVNVDFDINSEDFKLTWTSTLRVLYHVHIKSNNLLYHVEQCHKFRLIILQVAWK